MSLGFEDKVGLEEGFFDGRDVDLVKFSRAVARQLEGNLRPRAGRALAVGCRGLSVRAEADNSLDLAAVKCSVQQDLFAFAS